jgi:alkyl hydroperoxide reductase subunit F
MLDLDLKEQLTTVFAQLENTVDLVYEPCAHPDQAQLLEMLHDLASVSSKITVRAADSAARPKSDTPPAFRLYLKGKPTGVSFRGIPTGHEFTSLILAILNADGKGKLPDDSIIARIRRLKGPISIKTYISLTCENCPDVVQALNLMALLHPDFRHEMVDGGYVQDEIEALGIQGVPSVVVDGKLVHSGRSQFLDLISKLEAAFGTAEGGEVAPVKDLGRFDVVVIGGGPAGASAAIYSARKGLSVAMIAEKFGGQVQDTKGIENLISVSYTEGPQLAAQLNKHVLDYPVRILEHRRVRTIEPQSAAGSSAGTIHLEGGEHLTGASIIIATGAKWRELGVTGEKEYIGRGVAYCPHCDGPYYKGKKVAVVGGGNSGVEAAIDLAGIVREVVLLEFADQLKADQVLVEKLKALPNVSILTNAKTTEVVGNGQKVEGLLYENRASGEQSRVDLDGVFVQIGLLPNSQFVKGVVEVNKFGEIVVDGKGRTSAAGIYAAGDVTTVPFKQIIIAMGDGAKVALAAFEDRMYAGSGSPVAAAH